MPYAKNGDVRIYYESEGSGPPLLMNHPFAMSQQGYLQAGYVHALHEDFRVILMDLRGHGRSSKPHEPEAYGRAEQVGDIVAVLDDLGLRTAHYWGYSSGAWAGWSTADLAPGRLRSLVLGGKDPYTRPKDTTNPGRALKEGGMEALIARMRDMSGDYWKPALERMIRANDTEALAASLIRFKPSEPERYLPQLQIPILGYAGAEDPIHDDLKRACELAPLGRFISLEGLGQVGAFYERGRILPQAVAFMQEIEAGLTFSASA